MAILPYLSSGSSSGEFGALLGWPQLPLPARNQPPRIWVTPIEALWSCAHADVVVRFPLYPPLRTP